MRPKDPANSSIYIIPTPRRVATLRKGEAVTVW